MYHPKVEIQKKKKNKKIHQSKIELKERLIRERERERSPFLEENMRK